jgi:hypothetical protein
MEFYSALKKNEILLFAGKCMELEKSLWVRLARLRRPKNHMFSLIMQTLDLGQIQQCGWTWITWQRESTYGRYRNK